MVNVCVVAKMVSTTLLHTSQVTRTDLTSEASGSSVPWFLSFLQRIIKEVKNRKKDRENWPDQSYRYKMTTKSRRRSKLVGFAKFFMLLVVMGHILIRVGTAVQRFYPQQMKMEPQTLILKRSAPPVADDVSQL